MEEIKEIKITHPSYPVLLKRISNPPKILYVRGKIKAKENCVAIVGTRNCSNYGKQVAFEIARELAKNNITVVSGLAPGIDTFVHKAVVELKKRTIAVLGTGVDDESLYPKSNLKLVREILKNDGCLISEYPPGTAGTRFTFPQRNRIISGISLGVVVIEARIKSGALITAEWAKKQKRKVFAVPGSIYSSTSRGCHLLLKKGAFLVEKPSDILEKLNIPLPSQSLTSLSFNTKEEEMILNILKEGPLSVDEIIKKTNLSTSCVIRTLSLMETEDKVKNLGGDIYAIGNC